MTTNHTDLIRRLRRSVADMRMARERMRAAADALEAMQPSVREPLTDEQIEEIAAYYSLPYSTRHFVRAIEAMHGIGVKGKA